MKMQQLELGSTLCVDDASSSSSSSTSQRTGERGIRGKLSSEVPTVTSLPDTNPFFEESNPFLAQQTRTSHSRPHQRQQEPSYKSQDNEGNPFLVSSGPTQIKRQPNIVDHLIHDSGNFTHQNGSTEPFNTHPSPRQFTPPATTSITVQSTHHRSSSSLSSKSKNSVDRLDYQNVDIEDLKRARKELKAWEANFKDTYQRAATQDDITKDEVMTKKYRAYGKIKKALAAKEAKVPEEVIKSSGGIIGFTDLSNNKEPPRTPTKQRRTNQSAAVISTPTRKQEIEYVSPHNVASSIGFMSPSKANRSGGDRYHFNSGISSPSSQRISNGVSSPSRGTGRRSLLSSPSFKSPSSLFMIQELAKESSETVGTSSSAAHTEDDSNLPVVVTPSRTPKSKKASLLYLPNPLQSPSRSRTSPLFGGMNNRKPKRMARLSVPVMEDLEPEVIQSQIYKSTSPSNRKDELASDSFFMKSPITSTPQKSGAAKAARSLFRRPDASYPASPSSRRSLPVTPVARGNQVIPKSPSLYRAQRVNESGKSVVANSFRSSIATYEDIDPYSLQDSVHDAMDSMSIHEFDQQSLPQRHVTQGFDIDDQWDYVKEDILHNGAPHHTPDIGKKEVVTRSPHHLTSPSKPRAAYPSTTPRTPSQQPGLTFSQTTPGSAKSEVDTLFVPAGFHSHYRRRPGRPMLFVPSQEEDQQFEREFLGSTTGKRSETTFEKNGLLSMEDSRQNCDTEGAVAATSNNEPGNENDWEDHEGIFDSQEETPTQPVKNALPKKRFTQKRTTRLHRIAVAPSEKGGSTRPIKTPRTRKAAKPAEQEINEDDGNHKVATEQVADVTPASHQSPMPSNNIMNQPSEDMQTNVASTSKDESAAYGWANSNKPMTKSDRRMPGVGLGRAGPRRSSTIKYGSSNSDGNFVAYNLQRGRFKRGGARGKSRFGGSKFGGLGIGGQGSGRTLFDDESWRTEFDKDFDDATLAMSIADGGLAVEDEDEADPEIPWYGDISDVTDPYVVTVSKRYLQQRIGDINDPEEYVKELENKSLSDDDDTLEQGYRINLDHILKKVWGYPSFRDGQLDSIKRTLSYKSSLLVLPTGGGKSLSYQFPAYVFSKLGIPSLTLVISPMISLMYDQVKCLPPGLTGACWTSVEQSASQFKDFMEKLTSNTIKILFISPEKLQSQSFLSLVRTRRIPRIPFLCVDEVHCLSEWSHNFRPAYLLLSHVLKTDLKSPCVIGLTGTATEGTKDSICAMLDIDRMTGVLSGPVIRENLAMTVSLEMDRETALLNLLQSPRFANMNSILIYVMKQAQADVLAGFLRVRNFSAESYHAGKSPLDRQRIQHRFMNDSSQKSIPGVKIGSGSISTGGSTNGIRILVATIAFGLGLNKSNIRSVIHYCMPKSLENYIQEIGRSGRDGEKAYCHMFLNQDDYLRLRSLAYADGMDWGSILRLIKKLFSRRGIANATSTLPHKGGTTSVASKRRRGLARGNDSGEENGEDGRSHDESPDRTAKKLRQNDCQPLSVKIAKPNDNSVLSHSSLVMSTASILVIPPLLGVSLDSGMHASRKRLVVVRDELVEGEFDIKKEVLATLLSYIELDSSHPIKVLGSISAKCAVKFLQSPEALSELAENVPLIDMIIKQGVLTGNNPNRGASSSYGKGRRHGNKTGLAGTTLSMAYCCDTMLLCQQSGMTYTELVQEIQLWKRKKWAVFELSDPALCIEILKEPADCMVEYRRQQDRRDVYDMDIDVEAEVVAECDPKVNKQYRASSSSGVVEAEVEADTEVYEKNHDDFIILITDRLHRKLCAVERVGVAKVDQVYELFLGVATPTWQQQDAFQIQAQDSEEEDDKEEFEDKGEESSEYDEDADAEYIQMHARVKARTKAKTRNYLSGLNSGVSESEMILRSGIQEYFAKRSGEGIGGLGAEEELFQKHPSAACENEKDERIASSGPVAVHKTIRMYSYENAIVTNLQRKWRSAVEVDLKVFLNQQWQQQQHQSTDHSNSGMKAIDSPRVVSRIFHGISSPCFSALEWSRTKYWAKYLHFDFAQLMQMADRIIREQRQQRLSQR